MMRIKGYAARLINMSEAKASSKRLENEYLNNNRSGEALVKRLQNGSIVDPFRSGEALASHSTAPVWQKSFFDFPIYSDKVFEQKLDYIHQNPLRKKMVKNLDDYLYSSYQNYYLSNDSLISIDY